MKLGILETDQLSPELLQSFGSYGEQFKNLLQQTNAELDFEYFDIIKQQYPENIEQCDAYLITGSKFSAYDDLPWIHKLKQYIQLLHKHEKTLIGICFGHQLIAHALGGKTEKSLNGWGVGMFGSELLKTKEWMQDHQEPFKLLVSHQDQVVQLPDKAHVLASNDFCQYASFHIGYHILTFQGHPEFSKEYLLSLINNRRETLGEAISKTAIESLKSDSDSQIIAQWIINFINLNSG